MEVDFSKTFAENVEKLVLDAIKEDPELGVIFRDAIVFLPSAFDEPTRRKARNEFYQVVNQRLELLSEQTELPT